MRSSPPRSLFFTVAGGLCVAIPFALLAVVESLLRVSFPEKARERFAFGYTASTVRPDPEAIYTMQAGVKGIFVRSSANGAEVIDWETNADGYRGRALRAHADLRVVVYGDSNILAAFSTLQRTFGGRLEQYLAAQTGRDVEVINAGVIGYGPDQSLIRLARDLPVLRPDVVVLHVFADNDFGDLVRNRIYLVDSTGELKRHSKPVMRLPGRHVSWAVEVQQFVASLLLVRATEKALRLVTGPVDPTPPPDWIPEQPERHMARLLGAVAYEDSLYRDPRSDSLPDDHYDVDVAISPEALSANTKIRLMRGVLRRVHATTRQVGVRLLVLIQPSTVDLTTNMDFNYQYLRRYASYRPDRLTQLVRDICDEDGIDYVDLYPLFAANAPDRLFFRKDDDHWNDAGQDLAARQVAVHLTDSLSYHPAPKPHR